MSVIPGPSLFSYGLGFTCAIKNTVVTFVSNSYYFTLPVYGLFW